MPTNSKLEKVVQSIQVKEGEKKKSYKSRKERSSRGGEAADHVEEEEPPGEEKNETGEPHSSEFSGAPPGQNHFLCHEPRCACMATTRQREDSIAR